MRLESVVQSVMKEGLRPRLKRDLTIFQVRVSRRVRGAARTSTHSNVRHRYPRINGIPEASLSWERTQDDSAIRPMRSREGRRLRAPYLGLILAVSRSPAPDLTRILRKQNRGKYGEQHKHSN